MPSNASYAPIRDYAAIGDCHGTALVSRAGSVDWCCFGRFDADPMLCALLDAEKGGRLSLAPTVDHDVQRGYVEGTNLLRTEFKTPTGCVRVTDAMPVGRSPQSGVHDYVDLVTPNLLVRRIEGVSGTLDLSIAYRPSIAFGEQVSELAPVEGGIAVEDGPVLYADGPLQTDGQWARAVWTIRAGECRHLVLSPVALPSAPAPEHLERLLDVTKAFWREWIGYCRYDGRYRDAVDRSALALKLLTYAPTGAIVAAATTSLPESMGGSRNWDYRYCWLRDSCFTLHALASLGYGGEARRFSHFMGEVCAKAPPRIQIMYGIGTEEALPERELPHLEGYGGSRPVRVGNGAYSQTQIDVYGEFLDWAHLHSRLGGRFSADERRLLERLAELAFELSHKPDEGLWEARAEPRHYVHGKIMCWVALDRAERLLGRRPEWTEHKKELERLIAERGVDPVQGGLLQAFDRAGTDASLLQVFVLDFPAESRILKQTVAAIERELKQGDFVRRYRSDDGLEGDEGAFLICSFWLVDAYLMLDRYEEARTLFERLLGQANDVGLYAEEIEPETGAFLGNFPQAFTHLALIGSAINLDLYEKGGREALAGSHADRTGRTIGAVFGWRALWQAFRASGRVGRLRSSRRSMLPAEQRFCHT